MRPLSTWNLLEVWDRGADQPSTERALALLASACPERLREELAALSIGRRDGLLLDLRAATFGSDLVSVASCPACGERLETAFRVEDIRAESPAEGAGPFELGVDGWTVRFRLPDSSDLAALRAGAADAAEEDTGRELLLGRCVLAVAEGDRAATVAELPEEVVLAVGLRMEELDPQADVRIALGCPACGRRWESTFDILEFFWSEIGAWAERTLCEVHLLASAYGWREPDVLALSARRRQTYLQMVQG